MVIISFKPLSQITGQPMQVIHRVLVVVAVVEVQDAAVVAVADAVVAAEVENSVNEVVIPNQVFVETKENRSLDYVLLFLMLLILFPVLHISVIV